LIRHAHSSETMKYLLVVTPGYSVQLWGTYYQVRCSSRIGSDLGRAVDMLFLTTDYGISKPSRSFSVPAQSSGTDLTSSRCGVRSMKVTGCRYRTYTEYSVRTPYRSEESQAGTTMRWIIRTLEPQTWNMDDGTFPKDHSQAPARSWLAKLKPSHTICAR
jgi:hypothetical protein